MSDDLMTLDELHEAYGSKYRFARNTLYKWSKEGKLEKTKVGRYILVQRGWFEDFLKGKTTKPKKEQKIVQETARKIRENLKN